MAKQRGQIRDDLLVGADQIAEFLFGDPERRTRVYHLCHELPLFRMGALLCGRKSKLIDWVERQEAAGLPPRRKAKA